MEVDSIFELQFAIRCHDHCWSNHIRKVFPEKVKYRSEQILALNKTIFPGLFIRLGQSAYVLISAAETHSRASEEYLGEVFEGGLGEQLGFAEAGGVILFAANADAEHGVASEDVQGSDKAADPESFLA